MLKLYFGSHPPDSERMEIVEQFIQSYLARWKGLRFIWENMDLTVRLPFSKTSFLEEWFDLGETP